MKAISWHKVNEFPYLHSNNENEPPQLTPDHIKEGPYLIAEDEHGGTWGKFNQPGACNICGKEVEAHWQNLATGEQVCDEPVELGL